MAGRMAAVNSSCAIRSNCSSLRICSVIWGASTVYWSINAPGARARRGWPASWLRWSVSRPSSSATQTRAPKSARARRASGRPLPTGRRMARPGLNDRSTTIKSILIIAYWLQDCLKKSVNSNKIVNKDQEDSVEKFVQAFQNKDIRQAILECEDSIRMINQNVNQNLVYLSLIIKIRRIFL